MAASAFKQQCPSCEAMVPIKDPSFIGRKIDCPKCKYRFVVEDPGADEDDGDEAATEAPAKGGKAAKKNGKPSATGVTAKRPANGKAAPAKKRPGAKARRDDDEDDGGKPAKKKKKAGSPALLIGGILGGVAVLVLIVVGILVFSGVFGGGGGGGSSPTVANGPGSRPSTPSTPTSGPGQTQPGGEEKKEEEGKQALPPATDLVGMTNLLPNEADTVMSINVDRLVNSSVNEAVFNATGGFRREDFQATMGFPFDNVARVIWSAHHFGTPEGWQFSVVRTTSPVSLDTLKNLKLVKDPKSPIEGFDCYTITGDLDSLSRFLFSRRSNKTLDIHLYDPTTLIIAHQDAMQNFLAAKRERKPLTQPPAPPAEQGSEGQGPGGPGGPGGRGGPGGGGGSGPVTYQPPSMGRGGSGSGGRGGAAPPPPPMTKAYLTVKPELKTMLDELEVTKGKEQVILSAASDESRAVQENELASSLAEIKPIVAAFEKLVAKEQSELSDKLTKVRELQSDLGQKGVLGFALQQLTTTRLAGKVGYEFKDDKTAHGVELAVAAVGPQMAKALGQDLDLKVRFKNGEDAGEEPGNFPQGGQFGNRGSGMGSGMGSGGGGLRPQAPSSGGGAGSSAPPPGTSGSGGFGQGFGSGSGSMGRGRGSGSSGGMSDGPPGSDFRGGPNTGEQQQEEEDKDPNASTITLKARDTLVVLAYDMNLKDKTDVYNRFVQGTELYVLQARGREEMAGPSRLHALGAALKKYVDKNGQFPRGTVDRKPSPQRSNLPWPPDQRVSWMAYLLPHLGAGEFAALSDRINRYASWNDPDNLLAAQTLIPYYLAHEYPDSTWWGLYPGMLFPTANTHIVGVAGVGIDAATYAPGDAAVAKKMGVFGYDRATKPADITDGPEKTIVLIQVPADYQTPWLAGGGSTVRGVPETGSVKPFVCTTYQGKKGTFAVMGDGKVRFIPETISDKDFQALCTIAGGEDVDVDTVAPLVKAPDTKPVGRTAGSSAAPAPKP